MVEVSKEELEKIENRFATTPREVLAELLKCCRPYRDETYSDPINGKNYLIKHGSFLYEDFTVEFSIKIEQK